MHSSRMRTARSSSHPGGSAPGTPRTRHPPGPGTPPGADPLEQAPPRPDTPPGAAPLDQGHPCEQNFLTHACENITLPQTSLAGGN